MTLLPLPAYKAEDHQVTHVMVLGHQQLVTQTLALLDGFDIHLHVLGRGELLSECSLDVLHLVLQGKVGLSVVVDVAGDQALEERLLMQEGDEVESHV